MHRPITYSHTKTSPKAQNESFRGATHSSEESTTHSEMAGEEGDDDYMGDLSQFLPSDLSTSSDKLPRGKRQPPQQQQPTKWGNKTKKMSWKEQRELDRVRKQREEDERTKASLEKAIPDSNVGFKLLQRMGYKPGSAIGKDNSGPTEPIGVGIRRSRAGLGVEEEKARKEEEDLERKRRKAEEVKEEFEEHQRARWKGRQLKSHFHKAEAALVQLDKREVVPEAKNEDSDEAEKEEEEEQIITEEDLNDILMKLRDEHLYCLYCGCQYESLEELTNSCPGLHEEDH
ncbi:G patch domain-containing protein 11 [Rhynchospora pubera]|uniref:G patch domain-containing protein 11 n=1 Tax=Rhynchospora pubera TaxID=906938 RepID=A0AAV8CTP2_9POAL|nr:G patch domain-containing protein 11 [Rhynchospora pubera]